MDKSKLELIGKIKKKNTGKIVTNNQCFQGF